VGYLAAVETSKEAASVADLIGGAQGADYRADADRLQAVSLVSLDKKAAAALAACSGLRAARASGNISTLVEALTACGQVGTVAPDEMAKAERESREHERLHGSFPAYGPYDLTQQGRISLPTTPAALSRLGLAYNEAAVAICDGALAAAGGRGSHNERIVPSLSMEGTARGNLGNILGLQSGEWQRGVELLQHCVALLRQWALIAPPDRARESKRILAYWLRSLGNRLNRLWLNGVTPKGPGSNGTAEGEALLREALKLSEETNDVMLKQGVLTNLLNLSGQPGHVPAEAEALRLQLNALSTSTGRIPDTSCSICLEPLEQVDGGAEQDPVDGLGAETCTNSSLRVFRCGHQFHHGCLATWFDTRSDRVCPICKK